MPKPPRECRMRRPRRSRSTWAAMTAALLGALAAGCGGGGGGGGAAPTNFNTAEFQANFGLGSINVLSTYSGGFTGTGQTIAVIDTGIDVDHPDLDANIAAASTDIVTSNSAFLNDIDGHGTQVSGVAAAERNGVGTHGVAFNSQILAIRADSIGSCLTLCTFTNADVADAIDFAVANGAGVINLSLGGGASNADFLASVQAAVNAGVIFAIASGNTGGADPLNPANLATTASFNGQIIAVGAVDSSNAIASFSNRAGTVQNFYLVAPGVSIVTTNIGGGTTTVSGTSYSAPHVAGAVALTRQRFPALSATQIVDALLAAATDLGASGTDAIFGRGLLNVSAALAPLGATTLPAGASEAEDARAMVALDSSDMQLGDAFGDGIADALSRRPAIIVDAFGRAFVADVSGYVSPANERSARPGHPSRFRRAHANPHYRDRDAWLARARFRRRASRDIGVCETVCRYPRRCRGPRFAVVHAGIRVRGRHRGRVRFRDLARSIPRCRTPGRRQLRFRRSVGGTGVGNGGHRGDGGSASAARSAHQCSPRRGPGIARVRRSLRRAKPHHGRTGPRTPACGRRAAGRTRSDDVRGGQLPRNGFQRRLRGRGRCAHRLPRLLGVLAAGRGMDAPRALAPRPDRGRRGRTRGGGRFLENFKLRDQPRLASPGLARGRGYPRADGVPAASGSSAARQMCRFPWPTTTRVGRRRMWTSGCRFPQLVASLASSSPTRGNSISAARFRPI